MANYTSAYTGQQIDAGIGKANTALQPNTAITGATKTKITYDENGLVTAGADLSASDIPSLSASKITSGQFADARISSASTWNSKSAKSQVITCTLSTSGWVDNQQTVTTFSGGTIVANGFSYIVSPQPSSFSDYATCQVRALDVTVDGQMTFVRSSAGENAINVSILKCEVV